MNTRQQVFVEEYLKCWNSAEAARRAGYNGKSNVVGPRLLADVSIKAAIDERLTELKMSADEALKRLSDMARADIADFAKVRKITDLQDEQYRGKTHVIKKFKCKVTRDALNREHEEIEIELYGADGALEKIGRHHKLFTDKVEISWRDKLPTDKDPDEVLRQFSDLLRLAAQNAKS